MHRSVAEWSRAGVSAALEPKPFYIWFPSITSRHHSASGAPSLPLSGLLLSLCIFLPAQASISPCVSLNHLSTSMYFQFSEDLSCRFIFAKAPVYLGESFYILDFTFTWLAKQTSVRVTADKPGDRFFSFSFQALPWGSSAFSPSGSSQPEKQEPFLRLKKADWLFVQGYCSSFSLNHIKPCLFHFFTWASELYRPLHRAGEGW